MIHRMIAPKEVDIGKSAKKHLRDRLGAYLAGAVEACKCPVCQSRNIREARFRLRDIPFALLRAKPTRCMACYRRFYIWSWWHSQVGMSGVRVAKAK